MILAKNSRLPNLVQKALQRPHLVKAKHQTYTMCITHIFKNLVKTCHLCIFLAFFNVASVVDYTLTMSQTADKDEDQVLFENLTRCQRY